MRFYIASRFTRKDDVREVIAKLEKEGHKVTRDWTTHKETYPFFKNTGLSREYATEDVNGIRDCDVFIALFDKSEGSTGMHTEIGAAITLSLEKGKPLVYAVGQESPKSMFFYHPVVKIRKSVDDVMDELREQNAIQ